MAPTAVGSVSPPVQSQWIYICCDYKEQCTCHPVTSRSGSYIWSAFSASSGTLSAPSYPSWEKPKPQGETPCLCALWSTAPSEQMPAM